MFDLVSYFSARFSVFVWTCVSNWRFLFIVKGAGEWVSKPMLIKPTRHLHEFPPVGNRECADKQVQDDRAAAVYYTTCSGRSRWRDNGRLWCRDEHITDWIQKLTTLRCTHPPCPKGTVYDWNNLRLTIMDLKCNSTRVRVHDSSLSRRTAAVRVASMRPIIQSPWDGVRLMQATCAMDKILRSNFRNPVAIATWNVLTLAHASYPEPVVWQLII